MADVRQSALSYFVGMGWTPAQAAGIVANLWAESGLDPSASGDGGQAYGIAQWHSPRQANFQAIIGKPIQGSSLADQLAFVHAELVGTEKQAGDVLRQCTTAADAGSCVSRLYERPADVKGEALKRAALAEQILAAYGGAAADEPTVPLTDPTGESPSAPATPQPQPGGSMDPITLITVFGPLIANLIPQVASFFKQGDRAKQNVDTATKIIDTVVQATGSINAQDAVDKMQADPAALKKATDAVVTHPDIQPLLTLTEVGGGPAAAREADLKQQQTGDPFWKASAVFWMSVLLLPAVYWLIGSLIVGGILPALKTAGIELPGWAGFALALFGGPWEGETRSGGFNLVIGLILGGICGVYYGVSVTQAKQQQAAAQPLSDKGT